MRRQAIIKLGRGDQSDKKQMQSIMGLVFFGVPNRGMDIASLRAMVGDQPNRYILESIGHCSDLLLEQDLRFGLDFHYRDSPIISFYENKISPTALKVCHLPQVFHKTAQKARLTASGEWPATKNYWCHPSQRNILATGSLNFITSRSNELTVTLSNSPLETLTTSVYVLD